MAFSVHRLHTFEEKMKTLFSTVFTEAKVSSLSELNEAGLMKLNKNSLVNTILNLIGNFDENISMCKSAASKIDELKNEQIGLQSKLLKLQDDQMDSLKCTVKTELNNGFKSWSDVVKKNTSQIQSNFLSTTKKSVKQVIEKVNEEEKRSANLMIYGLPEVENENIGDRVESVYRSMNIPAPRTNVDVYRIGKKQEGRTRPIRVECQNSGDVDFALVHSRRLKSSENHSTVYLAPDRSKEQRLEHSALVRRMKDLISSDPTKHYFIRVNKVCSVDKAKD